MKKSILIITALLVLVVLFWEKIYAFFHPKKKKHATVFVPEVITQTADEFYQTSAGGGAINKNLNNPELC